MTLQHGVNYELAANGESSRGDINANDGAASAHTVRDHAQLRACTQPLMTRSAASTRSRTWSRTEVENREIGLEVEGVDCQAGAQVDTVDVTALQQEEIKIYQNIIK